MDGNKNGNYHLGSCTHTNWDWKTKPWWRVDLGKPSKVAQVKLVNREDCCFSRLRDFNIQVGNVDSPDANTL